MLYPNNFTARDAVNSWMEKGFYKVPEGFKVRSLVALSGGLDSIALMATLLAYTGHEVHAHHVDIRNSENRGIAENIALEKVLEYMRKYYRPFTFTTSKYEMGLGPPERVGADVSLVMFMMSRVNMALGFNQDIIWTAHMKGVLHEYMEAAAIHAAANVNFRSKPLWAMPFQSISKFNLYTAVSPELADLAWSCRFPIELPNGQWQQCGTCHACGAMRAVRSQVDRLKPAA